MVAVPLPVPTGRGTIEAFPELRRCEALDLGTMPAEFGSTVKHAFTARQFAQAFRAKLVSPSVLRLVIIRQLTDTRDPARARQLCAAQARQLITESCFTPRDEFWVRPWLTPRHTTDDLLRDQARTAIGHITATVPCVKVSFGVRNPITDLVSTLNTIVGETW